METQTLVLLNIAIVMGFFVIYHVIAMHHDDPDNPPHVLKSLFRSVSIHVPYSYNDDIPATDYATKTVAVIHNTLVQAIIITYGLNL